ncbi:MFS transporter [Bartonella machadoae]|uniref:MFS transporter n=1 Tax=Bartonella machadoae TaxID=2893471 RepID=UPI001F4C95FB|nr:MFS transporter [Bartonella machadoae]UNE53812.1 MFS transporter [Bartonella machadoae]
MTRKNKITFFIYGAVFLSEFSFFFVLPLLGISPLITAANVAFYLAGSVILESILMVTTTKLFEKYSRKLLMASAFILRSAAFLFITLSAMPSAWLSFFTLTALSKAIAKPFLREILTEHLNGKTLKRALTLYSFFQNAAVFIAPLVATITIKYNVSVFVLFFFAVIGLYFCFLSIKIVYNYPQKKTSLEKDKKTPTAFLSSCKKIISNRSLRYLLITALLCSSIMGIFLTTTTLLSKFDSNLAPYSGLFFSTVGISICLWQGIMNKHLTLSDKTTFYLIWLTGSLASFYLIGGVSTAMIALIAYSVYESVIIPEIYYNAGKTTAALSSSVIFSYILVVSNIGQAAGSWMSGWIISHFNSHVSLIFFMITIASTFASSMCLIQAKKHEDFQCGI